MTKKYVLYGNCLFCLMVLSIAAGNMALAEDVSREAHKHLNRGKAAAEMAKSPTEYEDAIREFEQAMNLAPDWTVPYFNLGYVQKEAGKYQAALDNFKKYLELAPNADDAAQVQAEIDQIEYKLEKLSEAAKIRGWLEGEWWMTTMLNSTKSRWPITFIVKGDSIEVYLPTARSFGHNDRFVDFKTIPIKQDGQTIKFSVALKEVIVERGISELMSTSKAQYTIDLTTSDKMEGTQSHSSKSYNSDGSIWKDLEGTEKVYMIKGKHADDDFIRSLMR